MCEIRAHLNEESDYIIAEVTVIKFFNRGGNLEIRQKNVIRQFFLFFCKKERSPVLANIGRLNKAYLWHPYWLIINF